MRVNGVGAGRHYGRCGKPRMGENLGDGEALSGVLLKDVLYQVAGF
jgi:hypothetical protein